MIILKKKKKKKKKIKIVWSVQRLKSLNQIDQ